MFPSHFNRFFARPALLYALLFLLFPACADWRGSNGNSASEATAENEQWRSEIPFATKEPEIFQAELVVTANESARRTLIARHGARRRTDYDAGTKNQLTLLETDKVYLLSPERRVFAETEPGENAPPADEWQNFLTVQWLNAKTRAKFDKLETAENLTRYRVAPAETDSAEILVWIDETSGLPVRQEFYSVTGGEGKTLTLTVELKNLRLAAEEELFAVPPDFKKVPAEELRKLLRAGAEN